MALNVNQLNPTILKQALNYSKQFTARISKVNIKQITMSGML